MINIDKIGPVKYIVMITAQIEENYLPVLDAEISNDLPNVDEYHYIMVCQYFKDGRCKLLNLPSRSNSSNVLSFERIMN